MPLNVKEWAYSFVYNAQKPILAATIAAPIAIEGAITLKKCFTNRKTIQRSISQINRSHLKKVAISGAIVAATGVVCYFTLPFLLATSATLLATAIVVKTCKDKKWVQKLGSQGVKWCKEAFVFRKGHPKKLEILRIARNVIVATAALVGVGVLMHALPYIAAGNLLVHFSSGWVGLNPTFAQIINAPILVVAGYSAMVVYGALKSIESFCRGNKKTGIYYAITALVGTLFPISFAMNTQMLRWHHSAYGLFMALLPLRSFNPLGWMVMLDSLLYGLNPLRKNDFDMANILQNNFLKIIGSVFVGLGIHAVRKAFCSNRGELEKPKPAPPVELRV